MDDRDRIPAYIYSLDKSGMVMMRQGVVLDNRTDTFRNCTIAYVGKQRLIVSDCPNILRRRVMWSEKPSGQHYISLIREELYKRRNHHQEQVKRINRQLDILRKAAKNYK
jgi:hypothetical protein